MLREHLGCRICWHLEFKAKTVTDVPSLPGTACFFMLCDENTHLYLTVLDMPRAVTEVHSMGDAATSPEDCPLRWFCNGTPLFPPFPTRTSPPLTSPTVWVSFFVMYNLGALLFGLLLIRNFQPRTVVSCGACLSPRKRPSWMIVWRVTTA